jgi:integrase
MSIEGIAFDPDADVWRIATAQNTSVFNFRTLPGVSEEFRDLFKDAFTALLLANAPERLTRLLSRLRCLLRFLVESNPLRCVDCFTAPDLQNYSAALPRHQQYFLVQIKEILFAWAKTGVRGLSHDLLHLLPTMETVSHEIGRAVRTMDPASGPLNDIEFESTVAAIRASFACGKMSLGDHALIVLAITLGARPMQLAMIKVKDLSVSERTDGSKVHILQITRLKQGKNIRPRTLFKARQLSAAVGSLIEQQASAAQTWAELNNFEHGEGPLFPSTTGKPQRRRLVLQDLRGHYGGANMSLRIARILTRLDVTSNRTGKKMSLFQTRLRRTLGSRAAAEGLSAPVIADLLDHSWVDSCLVYIETRPEIIERIDKALALRIAPLAQAFAGTLLKRPDGNASSDRGKTVHVITPEILAPVGACGKFDFCGLSAPIACYTCSYFNPWVDDIHETFLESLIAEREDLLQNADQRIASVNDRTILAVAEVVRQCAAAMGKT